MRTGTSINFAYQEASILIIRIAELYILKRIKDMLLPILMLLNAPLSCPIYGANVMVSINLNLDYSFGPEVSV